MEISRLDIADPPELWRSLGFDVGSDGSCVIGGIEHRLVGEHHDRRGTPCWSVTGIAASVDDIDGLATTVAPARQATGEGLHPNGVTGLDHLVIRSPDVGRTAAVLGSLGLDERAARSTDSSGRAVDMRFFWAGSTLLELTGPATPTSGDQAEPARIWGIAYTSDDLDATAAWLGDRCSSPRDAVQPGRRICAVRREAGSSMPIAIMSPHRPHPPR